MLFNPTQMHQCAQGKFLKAFFFSFFSVRLYLLKNGGSMSDISSGLMILITCFDWKLGRVMVFVKLSC